MTLFGEPTRQYCHRRFRSIQSFRLFGIFFGNRLKWLFFRLFDPFWKSHSSIWSHVIRVRACIMTNVNIPLHIIPQNLKISKFQNFKISIFFQKCRNQKMMKGQFSWHPSIIFFFMQRIPTAFVILPTVFLLFQTINTCTSSER